jgi:NAD(P)-dependent dehydrogenase (short-subunit alcohol dehydrogenase family)
MKHQIPAILQSGGGAIVNNASVLGLRPNAGSPIYSASKFAVVGLTKSVALEFAAKGVRVNAVCPAIIETDLTEQIRENDRIIQRLGVLYFLIFHCRTATSGSLARYALSGKSETAP